MTVVYIDSLFLLNLIINYMLLLATAKVTGELLGRWRMGLAAAFGAGYAAAIFFPGMGFFIHPACKAGAGMLIVLLAFGGSRRLLRLTLVFFGLSAAFGGGIYALELLGGQGLVLENGVVSSALDLKVVLLSAAVCYCLLTLVFCRTANHSGRELQPAILRLGGRQVMLTALTDTGNTLTDPATGKPVMVAEGARLAALLPQPLAAEELAQPVETMERLCDRRFRLLPYRAVGIDCGMLLAVRVDGVTVGKRELGSILVALSPTAVSDGGGYQALIGAV